SLVMRRLRQRLVALVSLAAFFVANTHAGLALAAHLAAPRLADAPAPQRGSNGHNGPEALKAKAKKATRSGCSCARHKTTKPRNQAAAPSSVPRPDKQSPCRPCCPDCPKGPSGSQCPCPGGCPLCSVAKVPCLSPFALFTAAPPCLGASL